MTDLDRLGVLVRGVLDRRVSGPKPVLATLAPRGSGLSAALESVERELRGTAPSGVIDGRTLRGLRPHEVALRLVWPLSEGQPGFRAIPFKRFLLGLAVVRRPVGDADRTDETGLRPGDNEALLEGIMPDRSTVQAWITTLVETAAPLAGAGQGGTELVTRTADAVLPSLFRGAYLRSDGVAWYRDGTGQHHADPVRGLLELIRWEATGHTDRVDAVLCRAFRDDLRAAFDRPSMFTRDRDCLMVVTNADTPAVQRFLDVLHEIGEPWCLGIVTGAPTRYDTSEVPPTNVTTLDRSSPSGWADPTRIDGGDGRYRVEIGTARVVPATESLTHPAVLAANARDARRPPRDTAFALRLTAGHRDGTAQVLAALPGAADRRAVLTTEVGGDHRRRLDEAVLDLVQGDWDHSIRIPLIRMALLRNLGDERMRAVLNVAPRPDPTVITRVLRYRSLDMWVEQPATRGEAGPPTLHPFARRAIAHRLGWGSLDGLVWDTVHAGFQSHARDRGDTTTELYHALARGRLDEVVRGVSGGLTGREPEEWFARLVDITAAPVKRPARDRSATDRIERIAGGGELISRRLVAALQLHTDPLGDPGHDVCPLIAWELGQLAAVLPDQAIFLIGRANEYQSCWNRWHENGGPR